MSKYQLKAEVRDFSGKEKAKKLRAAGKFPAIVYGAKEEPVSLTLPIREMEIVIGRIHGEKVLVDLSYGHTQDKTFIRNVQRDPVTGKILHADFFRVDPKREIDTKVHVLGVGVPAGVKKGGMLEHGQREVELVALPGDVPPHLEVNIENLEINDSIHVGDIKAIEGVHIVTPEDTVLFHVAGKKMEPLPEDEPAEGEGAAEAGEGEAATEEVAAES